MRYRRIIYIAGAAFLILYLLNVTDHFNFISTQPATMEVKTIIEDFKDLSDNEELPAQVREDKELKELYIPLDYAGQSGEVFYLVIDSSIYKYKIVAQDNKTKLIYELKDTFYNIVLPSSKFNIYEIK